MLTDSSFVLTVPPEPTSLVCLRAVLADRLSTSHREDDELLLVAALLVRQAQSWRGGRGPVRLRTTSLGPAVKVEVLRDVDVEGDTGPRCDDAFHGLLEVLADRTERFTVSTSPGTVVLSAQKVVQPLADAVEIDLRVAA